MDDSRGLYSDSNQSWPAQTTAFWLTLIATLMMAIGNFSPLWIWLDDGHDEVGVGLFYRVGLDEDQIQLRSTIPYSDVDFLPDDTSNARHWYAMTAVELVAMVCSAFVLFLLYLYKERARSSKSRSGFYALMTTLAIITCLFNAVGVILFIAYHRDAINYGPDVCDACFPWSWLLNVIALLLGIFVTLIILLFLRRSPFDDVSYWDNMAYQEKIEPIEPPVYRRALPRVIPPAGTWTGPREAPVRWGEFPRIKSPYSYHADLEKPMPVRLEPLPVLPAPAYPVELIEVSDSKLNHRDSDDRSDHRMFFNKSNKHGLRRSTPIVTELDPVTVVPDNQILVLPTVLAEPDRVY